MATKESILDRASRQGLNTPSAGMKVPDGYFEDFAARMAVALPERPELENPEAAARAERPTLWRRVRPYVYMAAMFAGIWLMLQMFAMIGMGSKLKPMDQNPVLAEALSDDDFMFDYLYDDYSTYELYGEVIDPAEGDYEYDYSQDVDLDIPENVILPDTATR